MPKNQFQRPRAIIPTHNVPRHGQQQFQPQKPQPKAKSQAEKPGLPRLEKLLGSEQPH